MGRNVRGTLFIDYVRMLRGHKGIDWSQDLPPEDLAYLSQVIDAAAWYPMSAFERLGNAILREIARGDMRLVRSFGRYSVDRIHALHRSLVADGDPVETLSRFRVLRSTFFDFDALDVVMLHDDEAKIAIRFHMGNPAEEAASHQTMGFFERLIELAGAATVEAAFSERSWTGDARTLLELAWKMR